jgi:hypothetical protein
MRVIQLPEEWGEGRGGSSLRVGEAAEGHHSLVEIVAFSTSEWCPLPKELPCLAGSVVRVTTQECSQLCSLTAFSPSFVRAQTTFGRVWPDLAKVTIRL